MNIIPFTLNPEEIRSDPAFATQILGPIRSLSLLWIQKEESFYGIFLDYSLITSWWVFRTLLLEITDPLDIVRHSRSNIKHWGNAKKISETRYSPENFNQLANTRRQFCRKNHKSYFGAWSCHILSWMVWAWA
jgi:hypothetical protein